MKSSVPGLDPSLIDPSLNAVAVAAVAADTKLDENEDIGVFERESQAEHHNSDEKNIDMVDYNLGDGLEINLMSGNDGSGSGNSNVSAPNRNDEYSEQESSEQVSDEDESSTSEYSDEEDLTYLEKTMRQVENMQSAQTGESWMFTGVPLNVRVPSPPSPPSYSPPPTPTLRPAPLFPPGFGVASAALFESPVLFSSRINARKVRMHEARMTYGERRLRELAGTWRRTSKVPTPLRRCWTPYDIFDAYLENTVVAYRDYGAEKAETKKGAVVLERLGIRS
ncbi:hypothetical protein DSL72_005561 [Monilinia vaccinii-corymbosi]|uniref:Uncharacterized protein n=1 Tax=Monilinia vaccinii-corymbosi TaxID=61207 RepID=A0A8A3PG24_9HELO|nr:hypothetical protein DSL72_005561 [Monilinia vaccinii-corymbosi]